MRCETAREAISALLDNEDPGVPVAAVEEHRRGCRSCQAWEQAAHAVTRSARVETAQVPSSDPARVARGVRSSTRVPRRASRLTLARIALVAVAVGQVAIALPVLVFGRDHSAPMHVAHEMGSFDLALAIGFFAVAWRPDRARGMRPLVGAVALLLMVTAGADLVSGRTSIGDEASHLLTVAAWLLLVCVAYDAPPSTAEPGRIATALRRHRLRSSEDALGERADWLPNGLSWPAAHAASVAHARSIRRRKVA